LKIINLSRLDITGLENFSLCNASVINLRNVVNLSQFQTHEPTFTVWPSRQFIFIQQVYFKNGHDFLDIQYQQSTYSETNSLSQKYFSITKIKIHKENTTLLRLSLLSTF